MAKLTPMQRKFCSLYARSGDVMGSAIGAGYSKLTANKASHMFLDKPHIATEVRRLQKRVQERADKSAVDVVNEYSKIAFTDRLSFLKEDPIRPGEYMFKAPDELTDEQRTIVERVGMTVKKVEGVNEKNEPITVHRQQYTYTLSDKSNALQQMGRHFGIFDDKLRISGTSNPFKNVSSDQLLKLKQSFTNIMVEGSQPIEGEYSESK